MENENLINIIDAQSAKNITIKSIKQIHDELNILISRMYEEFNKIITREACLGKTHLYIDLNEFLSKYRVMLYEKSHTTVIDEFNKMTKSFLDKYIENGYKVVHIKSENEYVAMYDIIWE